MRFLIFAAVLLAIAPLVLGCQTESEWASAVGGDYVAVETKSPEPPAEPPPPSGGEDGSSQPIALSVSPANESAPPSPPVVR
ncbi:MAG: hypothetical protein LBI57_01235 [Helicobacteraceae bacterium]|jgi:hypothetical protein|nr:hypothetical protein [Helicobacteraceae bacterium]